MGALTGKALLLYEFVSRHDAREYINMKRNLRHLAFAASIIYNELLGTLEHPSDPPYIKPNGDDKNEDAEMLNMQKKSCSNIHH